MTIGGRGVIKLDNWIMIYYYARDRPASAGAGTPGTQKEPTMSTAIASRTVGEIVAESPAAARVFERHAIDYCCGGNIPLSTACERRGAPLDKVLHELEEALATGPAADDTDWRRRSMSDLIDHIESTHHARMRSELPRARELIGAVVRAHGESDPTLHELAAIFDAFASELEMHLLKEERVLFPAIRSIEQKPAGSNANGGACCAIEAPIRVMMEEHDHSGEALKRMRALTNDFTPPPGACNTYRVMIDTLAGIERDIHQHVHKENNILFPGARAMTAARSAAAPGA
ncbi:MAG: iron-sulfur cluster repair di-iron protein [Phycisphaeraceae bacterium]|nr:MAG: iron-sulfur cluster repair di-iron protein [Phycisphaeraceae bacterium]